MLESLHKIQKFRRESTNKVSIHLRQESEKMRKTDKHAFSPGKIWWRRNWFEKSCNGWKRMTLATKRRFTTLGEVMGFLEARKSIETNDDPFVLGIKHSHVGEDGTKLQFFVSTSRFLHTAKRFRVLACDATYKTNAHGYPLLILGGLDANQKLHVLAYCVLTNEEVHVKYNSVLRRWPFPPPPSILRWCWKNYSLICWFR